MPMVMRPRRRRTPAAPTGGLGGILDILLGIGINQASAKGVKVRVRSQLTPDLEFDPLAKSAPDAQPGWFLRLTKPEVTIDSVAGSYVIAPGGTPTHHYYGLLLGFFAVWGMIGSARWMWRKL